MDDEECITNAVFNALLEDICNNGKLDSRSRAEFIGVNGISDTEAMITPVDYDRDLVCSGAYSAGSVCSSSRDKDEKIEALEKDIEDLKDQIEYCKKNGIWVERP